MTVKQKVIHNWLISRQGFLKKGKESFYNYYRNKIDSEALNKGKTKL